VEDLGGKSNGRGRITLGWFGQDLALGNLRKLANDLVPQMIIGQNPDSLRRQHGTKPVDGLLDQGAFAEQAQDLLGTALAALGPEACSPAAGQDQPVNMFH
jgi:hypothetical protein